MFSRVRRPSLSTSSSDTTFSSDNFYIPIVSTPRPNLLRQLNVHDLNQHHCPEREPFRIPRPIITVPRTPIHLPPTNLLWTPATRPTHGYRSSSSSSPFSISQYSERQIYQNLPFESIRPRIPPPPPSPPPLPPPLIPTQYQIGPPPFKRQTPIRITQVKRHKKYLHEKPPGLFTTLCAGGFTTVLALLYLCFLLALPIVKLVIGSLYEKQCPVNKNIPLYVIISGACGLSIAVLILFTSACAYYRSSLKARKRTHGFIIFIIAISRGLRGFITLFLFIWFFVGNIWVFNARYRVRTDKPNDANNYCHPTLYWFAYYGIIFTYIYAIFICCIKFCINFCCCGVCDGFAKAFS